MVISEILNKNLKLTACNNMDEHIDKIEQKTQTQTLHYV